MTIYDKLKNWAEERLIHKVPFDKVGYTQNIIEELCEMWGLNSDQTRVVAKTLTAHIYSVSQKYDAVSEEATTDAINDISVFSATAQVQRGIDMNKAMEETYKEINSRQGEYIEEEKKWCKFTDDYHKSLWYKADYSNCKLEDTK